LRRTQQTLRKGKQNWEYWLVFFLRTMVKQKNNLAAKVKEEQALRSSLPALSRQILELAKTRKEITVKEIEEFTGRTATPSKRLSGHPKTGHLWSPQNRPLNALLLDRY